MREFITVLSITLIVGFIAGGCIADYRFKSMDCYDSHANACVYVGGRG